MKQIELKLKTEVFRKELNELGYFLRDHKNGISTFGKGYQILVCENDKIDLDKYIIIKKYKSKSKKWEF